VFWRPGYVSGEFVAKTDAKATTTLASSPGLRGPHPPRETAKSTAALEALVEQLAREGWVPSGRRGRDWFELEFARSLEAAETCRIEWSHAYVTARFEAVISKASGEREFIADSPDFRCLRDRPPEPDDEHARKALDELVAELKTFGWWTSGQGDEWFALEFRRHRVPSGAGPAWR